MKFDLAAKLKRAIPTTIKDRIKTSPIFVRHRSGFVNVFHCSVYRTGSQWMRGILADRRICRHSGLLSEMFFHRTFDTPERADQTTYRAFPNTEPFREKRIVGFYTSYESYLRVPKPDRYRTFFVSRDPRDIVVSHYFASRRDARRSKSSEYQKLADPETGIPHMMDRLVEMRLFAALDSWADVSADPNVSLLRFEDLIGQRQLEIFKELFAFCDITVPDGELAELLADHNFEKLSAGRKQGQVDENSHYRKGIAGYWKNYFTNEHLEKLRVIRYQVILYRPI
ncbi:MAG: sulfotransferase domain-containing protein [Proteobacteria bacterium]|nr:sulfotransferase domain-containing protein [Pseudomonadota bacterium]